VIRLLGLLVVGFNLWMLVDAYRRRAETFWLYIIAVVPGASLAYFFMVKLRDRDMQVLQRRLLASFEKPPPPNVLRRRYKESPSVANRLALAQGLTDSGHFVEAKQHFEALLDTRSDEPDALFGRGVCQLELGETDAAAATFSSLMDLAPSYRDYAAWPELAEALERLGRSDESLTLVRQLVQRAPRLPHQVLLATKLRARGHAREAEDLLSRSLREYDESPRHVRKANRAAMREAKRLLVPADSG
jgi:hypothetical protein